MNRNIIDVTGKRFNRWTVIDYVGIDNRHEALWLCRCDCGTLKNIRSSTLRYGTSKGCPNCRPPSKISGCDYKVCDNYAVFKTTHEKNFIVSLVDAEKVKKHSWSLAYDGYVVANVNGSVVKLHHFLIGRNTEGYVDHINGDKLDNRRENLRAVTPTQNACNCKIYSNNTSGYKGVCWNRKLGKWQSNIGFGGKIFHLGFYDAKEKAAIAYNDAAKKIHKEYACLNPIGDTNGYRVWKDAT